MRRRMLDDIDVKLLFLLQRDARMTHRALGSSVSLAASSVCERIKRLEQDKAILGYRANVAPTLLTNAEDLLVKLQLSSLAPAILAAFERELASSDLVLGAARTGGSGAYQLRLLSRAAVTWVEHLISRTGGYALTFEVTPVIAEIVAYRDPPIARSQPEAKASAARE